MHQSISFSRFKLNTYLACKRRFQLRYLKKTPWPIVSADPQWDELMAQGRAFHQLMERHFLGLPVKAEDSPDPVIQHWFDLFKQSGLRLPAGRLLPETNLSVPIAGQYLTGRFDLLVMGTEDSQPFAHVFDWKTGRAEEEAELRKDWQTRLYFALLAQGSEALLGKGVRISPEQIKMTYWFVSDPGRPRTLSYDRSWHAQNWSEIAAIIDQIQADIDGGDTLDWPLTSDWAQCRYCPYQSYCDRRGSEPPANSADDFEEDVMPPAAAMEPTVP